MPPALDRWMIICPSSFISESNLTRWFGQRNGAADDDQSTTLKCFMTNARTAQWILAITITIIMYWYNTLSISISWLFAILHTTTIISLDCMNTSKIKSATRYLLMGCTAYRLILSVPLLPSSTFGHMNINRTTYCPLSGSAILITFLSGPLVSIPCISNGVIKIYCFPSLSLAPSIRFFAATFRLAASKNTSHSSRARIGQGTVDHKAKRRDTVEKERSPPERALAPL